MTTRKLSSLYFTFLRRTPALSRRAISRSSDKPISSSTIFKMSAQAAAVGPPSTSPGDTPYKPRYIDIGINLADPIFRGQYHATQRHPDDLDAVVSRAREVGCQKLIVTGSDLLTSKRALEIAKEYPGVVYTTAGIHPCSSAIFGSAHAQTDVSEHTIPDDVDPSKPIPDDDEPDPGQTAKIIAELRKLIEETSKASHGALAAFGEFGLDYDRLHYCSKTIQLHSFAAQLDLALSIEPQLPLFLHSRAAHADFVSLLKAKFGDRLEKLQRGGVVHSFTGTVEEMRELMDLGLHIGTNGCSFKTAENCAVAREIYLDRLMLETDGPWCEIRPTHEGWKYLVEQSKTSATATLGENSGAASTPATATPTPTPSGAVTPVLDNGDQHQQQAAPGKQSRPKQQPPKSSKKPQKKESEVPERYRTVKKEKWVEGVMVKGRNEPCTIERVGQVVAGVKGVPLEEVCEAAWRNTVRVFGLGEK